MKKLLQILQNTRSLKAVWLIRISQYVIPIGLLLIVAITASTTLRLPSTRVTDARGQDMEMHPRPVDVLAIRPVGESYTGNDSQLDAAVRELLGSLTKRP